MGQKLLQIHSCYPVSQTVLESPGVGSGIDYALHSLVLRIWEGSQIEFSHDSGDGVHSPETCEVTELIRLGLRRSSSESAH